MGQDQEQEIQSSFPVGRAEKAQHEAACSLLLMLVVTAAAEHENWPLLDHNFEDNQASFAQEGLEEFAAEPPLEPASLLKYQEGTVQNQVWTFLTIL